jgi:hypothetical protein
LTIHDRSDDRSHQHRNVPRDQCASKHFTLSNFRLARFFPIMPMPLPALPSGVRDFDRSALMGGLEQFDDVAGGIFEQDLRASNANEDIVAERQSSRLQPINFCCEVGHRQKNAIPTARDGTAAIGHGTRTRAGRAAQQQPEVPSGDRSERWGGVLFNNEAEILGVESERWATSSTI